MVLTFPSPPLTVIPRLARWIPNIVSWIALLLVAAVLGWSYFSNPKPGPYGVCYTGNGRAISGHPCPVTATHTARR